jgi:hypothetical protein
LLVQMGLNIPRISSTPPHAQPRSLVRPTALVVLTRAVRIHDHVAILAHVHGGFRRLALSRRGLSTGRPNGDCGRGRGRGRCARLAGKDEGVCLLVGRKLLVLCTSLPVHLSFGFVPIAESRRENTGEMREKVGDAPGRVHTGNSSDAHRVVRALGCFRHDELLSACKCSNFADNARDSRCCRSLDWWWWTRSRSRACEPSRREAEGPREADWVQEIRRKAASA